MTPKWKSKKTLGGIFLLVVAVFLFPLFFHQRSIPPVFPRFGKIQEKGFSPKQYRPARGKNAARDFGMAIADAIERVMPSVVVIRTKGSECKIQTDPFGFPNRICRQIFGQGSGVIIDERGYVLTSRHILIGAHQVKVVLNDGLPLPAILVGDDRATDLAVLKIQAKDRTFPAVEFGDSDRLRVGEIAIAIGSPFSLQSSATVGHISQKGRHMEILPYEDFIQTDAAINKGNSGGPLINADGRLIGINAAIQTDAEEHGVGIAFAIPSNLAMVIAKSLIEKGVHEWPWVGAFFSTIFSEKEGKRVLVKQVWRDTPAAQAGMLPNDLVLQVNNEKVETKYDVYRIIFNHSVGESVHFLLKRDNKKIEMDLPLEEFPRQP